MGSTAAESTSAVLCLCVGDALDHEPGASAIASGGGGSGGGGSGGSQAHRCGGAAGVQEKRKQLGLVSP